MQTQTAEHLVPSLERGPRLKCPSPQQHIPGTGVRVMELGPGFQDVLDSPGGRRWRGGARDFCPSPPSHVMPPPLPPTPYDGTAPCLILVAMS